MMAISEPRWNALTLTAVLVLSGCLGAVSGPDGATPQEGIDDGTHPVVVHGPEQGVLDPSTFPGEPPMMAQRYVDHGTGYEPTTAVTTEGTAFYPLYGTFDDQANSLSQMSMMRSRDDGVTWQDVTPQVAGRDAVPLAWDPISYVDPATDRLYFAYTYVGCMEVLWSDDEGETWERNPVSCAMPFNDHQSLFSGPAPDDGSGGPVVYLCSSQVATFHCLSSVDGGRTWRPSTTVMPHPITAPDGSGEPDPCPERLEDGMSAKEHGHGAASWADGTAYLPFNLCGRAYVATSQDGGLTWTVRIVDSTAGEVQHEARVAVDAAGNAYYFWVGADHRPRLSISQDRGRTWSKPIRVGAPGITYTLAPYIGVAAGREGRVAFIYMATDAPGGLEADAGAFEEHPWKMHVGVTLDALAEDPVFATTLAHAPNDPIHRGGCSSTNYCGSGSNSLAHYMDLGTNPVTGRLWAALVDGCVDECAGPNGTCDPGGANRAAVSVQVGGARLGPNLGPSE